MEHLVAILCREGEVEAFGGFLHEVAGMLDAGRELSGIHFFDDGVFGGFR